MKRTQIQLPDDQARELRAFAAREGRSMADVVRESVGEYLARHAGPDREEIRRRAREVVGRYASGMPDLATDHDRHVAEAIERC